MTAFEFMANSPFLTIVLACLAFGLLRALMRWVVVLVNGYPPMWCDSEGRFRPESKDE